jgi:glycine dehydrogenase
MDHLFPDQFQNRHIGPNESEVFDMLQTIGVKSIDKLIDETVPASIRLKKAPKVGGDGFTELEYLNHIREVASQNKVFKNYIGLGYYDTFTPSVILRNIFENPGWYTQYTPYQAEIAQGRLEALLNYQTMVADLTGFPVANASLLDEGTAASEAMIMLFNAGNKNANGQAAHKFFVDESTLPQTIEVLKTRSKPLNIELVIGDFKTAELNHSFFGAMVQYPSHDGKVNDYKTFIEKAHSNGVLVVMATDLLALTLLTPPAELGAEIAIGSSQRFGVPMGNGGPHAAFFATKEEYKRNLPGRIIGVSIDAENNRALRMALQTREQHIRREKATSNICTAQALLAIMAGMYAVYHGAEGLKSIAYRVHTYTNILNETLKSLGYECENEFYFDTLKVNAGAAFNDVKILAEKAKMNFRYVGETIFISLDECTSEGDLEDICKVFAKAKNQKLNKLNWKKWLHDNNAFSIQDNLRRSSSFLMHPIFNTHRSESQMMRYIKSLENKDLSLTTSMISLGSCTMKLNAASEMIPVSWAEFSKIHPFAPAEQMGGYIEMIKTLEKYLCDITGFAACSLQPNSGAQGEYAGLLVIKAYHEDRNEPHRNIALIPTSAHGTNPASAAMCGMNIVAVKCDEMGNIDVADLREKATQHASNLACLMVTYPSTHGVFEESIIEICQIIHDNGGMVYMDGANMNAQVGLTSPATIGADVNHINLHKTFAIPHGGGGPGMGPICCNEKLAPYLPKHIYQTTGGERGTTAVSAAPWGSASILLISYAYIKMLGSDGITNATKYAILNANYMKTRLAAHYNVLYTGNKGRVAHEFILDCRPFKAIGVEVVDIAKRLMDYGFHAPTVSFPVAGTLMIEPTESEDKGELDRFCDALISIREEIKKVENATWSREDNPLHNAPHTLQSITASGWTHSYSREEAAFPLPFVRHNKFWASVARVNDTHGDRNLICTCPSVEEMAMV